MSRDKNRQRANGGFSSPAMVAANDAIFAPDDDPNVPDYLDEVETHVRNRQQPESAIEIAPKFQITSTGAKIIGNVTEQDIIDKLREVSDAKKADFWFYGDMLAFAEDSQWGSIYTQAAIVTGKSEKTLRNYVWVARAVHLSLRGEKGLTLDHYKLIAPMKPGEQQQWIGRVQENGWSSAQLKAAINGDTIPAANDAPKGWQKIEGAILKAKGIDKSELIARLRQLADQLESND